MYEDLIGQIRILRSNIGEYTRLAKQSPPNIKPGAVEEIYNFDLALYEEFAALNHEFPKLGEAMKQFDDAKIKFKNLTWLSRFPRRAPLLFLELDEALKVLEELIVNAPWMEIEKLTLNENKMALVDYICLTKYYAQITPSRKEALDLRNQFNLFTIRFAVENYGKVVQMPKLDFSNRVVRGSLPLRISAVNMSNSRFVKTVCPAITIKNSRFHYCKFYEFDTKMYANEVDFEGSIFEKCNLFESVFKDCDLVGVDFKGSKLHGVFFTGSSVQGAKFYRTNGLTKEQILSMKNWKFARLPKKFKGLKEEYYPGEVGNLSVYDHQGVDGLLSVTDGLDSDYGGLSIEEE